MRVFEREHRKEISPVKSHVDFTIHDRPTRLDIRDVKKVLVRPAREIDRQRLANSRIRAVTARNKGRLAGAQASVRVLEAGDETIAAVLESDELGLSLHGHAGFAQPVD